MSLLRIVAAIGALLFAGVFAACVAFDRGDPVPLRAGAASVSNAQTCLSAESAAPAPPDGMALQGYDLVVVTSDATTESEPLPGTVTSGRAEAVPTVMGQRFQATSVDIGRTLATVRLQC